MNNEFILVMITTPDATTAEKISIFLLESGLVACTNIVAPILSLYTWNGQLNRDDEVLIIAKTRRDLFNAEWIHAVKSIHPYEVPEIIALPILAGSQDYLDWIRNVTKG